MVDAFQLSKKKKHRSQDVLSAQIALIIIIIFCYVVAFTTSTISLLKAFSSKFHKTFCCEVVYTQVYSILISKNYHGLIMENTFIWHAQLNFKRIAEIPNAQGTNMILNKCYASENFLLFESLQKVVHYQKCMPSVTSTIFLTKFANGEFSWKR